MRNHIKKPNLIILEGPASVGKTALQKFLQNTLESKTMHVEILPEFSNNAIGRLLESNCKYGQPQPDWLQGISGLMLFIKDKINEINKAINNPNITWICDRFFCSQFILGLKSIRSKEDTLFAQKIIQQVSELYLKKISKVSLFIFLDGNVDILQKRLEMRIHRKLTKQELKSLNDDILGYRQLAISYDTPNTYIVVTDLSINIVGNKILDFINSKWHI